jgi:hypothetical protein
MKKIQAFIFGIFTILFICATMANAATWTVTKSTNSNDGACNADCSLREAVAAADSGDTVNFSPNLIAQIITLGGSEIVITKRITIDGFLNNPNVAFISGNNTSRIFLIETGGALDLRNATLVQGNGASGNLESDYGGAIFANNNTNLSLDRVAVRGNRARFGGAIYLRFGTLHSTNSSITNNSAEQGTAILAFNSTILMSNTTVSGNYLYIDEPQTVGCGAIATRNTTVTIRNSTIANNSAKRGGGICVINSGNPTPTNKYNIGNTIVAGNTATIIGQDINYTSPQDLELISAGGNLIQNLETVPAGIFTAQNDITGVNPLLAPINANSEGFPIQVHPLQAGSPARNGGLNQNAVNPLTTLPLTTDARGAGFPRITDGTVDIGAFEDQSGNTSLIVSKKTNSNDLVCDTDCSLREAVHQAGLNFGTDTITFAPNVFGTLELGGSEIVINNQNVNIVGYPALNADTLIVSGGDTNRIFRLNNANVSLVGLTLADGNSLGSVASGFGGAVYAEGGSLMLDRVVVQNNSAVTSTGGIYFYNGANHRILNSTFSGNQTGGGCGGFNVIGGTMFMANVTVSRNTATFGGGGFCTGANTIVRNSTVTGNSVSSLNGAGGGIRPFGGNLNLGNTIVAGNNAATQPELSPIDGAAITSAGHNHIGDSAGDSTGAGVAYQTSDTRDVPPLLGELADNGGAVPTHSLMANSPAINTGDNAKAVDPFNSSELANDARGAGFARINGTVDKGAFESSFAPTAASVTIAGRVLAPSGKGVSSARVYLTDSQGETRTALTNQFGYFRFENVAAGETYVFNVFSKRYSFQPQVINVTQEINDLNFTAGQ